MLADEGNGLPHYQNVRQQLRADLESGRWKPGDMLPTEAELARHFGLSVGTIRQAVLALVREGLLTRRPGRGTFVARFDTGGGFGRFFHFREDLRDKVVPSVHHIDTIVLKTGDRTTASKLRLAPRAPLYRVRRVLMSQGEPICLYISYLDKERFPGLDALDLEDQRLYAVIEKHYGVHVRGAEEILRAGSPDADEASHLGITVSTPVMIIERTALGSQGAVIEWRRTVGSSDQFHYKITLP